MNKNSLSRDNSKILNKFSESGYILALFWEILKNAFLIINRGKISRRVLIMQLLFTAVNALVIIGVTAAVIGAAIIFIGSSIFASFGQSQLIYSILVIIIARELGPLLTAFIVIARSGTAIATELGGMVVSHEIEAYLAVGINPISFLAAPRLLGVTISIVLLSLYFDFFGLLVSFIFVQFTTPLAFNDYLGNLFSILQPFDILSGVVKSIIFGLIISVTSIYYGFSVGSSTTEIPNAVNKAVSNSFISCIIAYIVLTLVSYILFR